MHLYPETILICTYAFLFFQISLQMKFYIRQYLPGDVATVLVKVVLYRIVI